MKMRRRREFSFNWHGIFFSFVWYQPTRGVTMNTNHEGIVDRLRADCDEAEVVPDGTRHTHCAS
jgi:hypothetical protein